MRPTVFTFLTRGAAQVQKFGWRLLWHRYITRKRILRAGSIECPENAGLEIHMQVCARDWLNALWTIRSFWHHARQPFQLLLLCDHTVTDEMQAKLRHRLPGADIINCDPPAASVRNHFAEKYPELYRLRLDRRFSTLPKILDTAALRRRDVVLTIDPDVLFFAKPDELLADLDPSRPYFARYNVPRRDANPRGAFSLDPDALREHFGLHLPLRFNCGLGSMNYSVARWDWVEQILKTCPPNIDRGFLLEQTICWILSDRAGWESLPTERYVLEPVDSLDGVVARHYFGKTRDLFYVEGIAELTRRGLLN